MSSFLQEFFIDGQYLGTAGRKSEWRGDARLLPISQMFYCGLCGEVWARLPVYELEDPAQPLPRKLRPWQSYRHVCSKCRNRTDWLEDWPGSIWHALDEDYTASLPLPVLRREVLVLSLQLDRFPNDSSILK